MRLASSSIVLAALSCLVAACSGTVPVSVPIAPPKMAGELMRAPLRADCAVPQKLDPVPPRVIEGARVCSAREADGLAAHVTGLQSAVRVREAAVDKAVAAAAAGK